MPRTRFAPIALLDLLTDVVWISLEAVAASALAPSSMKSATSVMENIWMVFFMFFGPESAWKIGKDDCCGWRQVARNWAHKASSGALPPS